jgi:hypothetical protein
MKNAIIFACVWVCIGGTFAQGQGSGQTFSSHSSSPTRPGTPIEAPSGVSPPHSVVSRAEEWVSSTDGPFPVEGRTEEECHSPLRFWAKVDYLVWWLKPVCLKPPTLTVGSPADAIPGAVGQPHTELVMGEHKFEFSPASGIRPSVGVWLTSDQFLSWETEGLLLEQVAASQSFRSSNGSPASFIPFQDPSNVNQALPLSIPALVNGGSVAVGSSRLWGVESDLAGHFSAPKGGFLLSGAVLFGLRYLDLEDRVTITNRQTLVNDLSAFAVGADRFATRNEFYGGQLGSRLGLSRDRWSLELLTKMALGETHQLREVTGQPLSAGSVVSPLLLPGPFLALPSNVGRETADRITLVPEIGVTVHYDLTERVSVSLGYSCLYWNKVLCPGDQMDSHANVTQLPFHGPVVGPRLPAPIFEHTDAFAQGLNVGLGFRY